ncbi:MAG: DUF362 domain-containing protein [Eubacteriales bacterium]|jgi:uncharacterized Fe-S center protein|nr:DUF362 domain-containing protein [Eubacteriales bacterium]
MSASRVYFTNFRSYNSESMPQKLHRLCRTAGIERIDFQEKYAAIKMHFGEVGNLAFLRPNYARVVADYVKRLGGKPYLTDCNTLYVGMRSNALDHLDAAALNGFTPQTVGCHVIIGDGVKGMDEVHVSVEGDYVRSAKIGRAVMDADVFISLTHFKGHESTGFGGTLKNIGMGCGSYEGKKEMHSSEKPAVDRDGCIGCGICRDNCAHNAITIWDGIANIDTSKCTGCGRCISACPQKTIHPMDSRANEILVKKIAEYSLAVTQNRPCFHVSLIMDVSPYCDCHAENDAPIIPDIGMLASFDPVALDQACADLVNREIPIRSSLLAEQTHLDPKDHFHAIFGDTDWQVGLAHAEKLGLGTRQYELVTMK